jgi:hypothetical protein
MYFLLLYSEFFCLHWEELEEQYFQILANRGIDGVVGLIGGALITPITLGYTKPCYLEVELIASLAQSIIGSGDTSPGTP